MILQNYVLHYGTVLTQCNRKIPRKLSGAWFMYTVLWELCKKEPKNIIADAKLKKTALYLFSTNLVARF